MNNTKRIVLDTVFMLNRLVLFTLYAFGIDNVSKITNIPWQIIFIITLLLFSMDLKHSKTKKRDYFNNKVSAFIEKNVEILSPSQIMEINSWCK